MFLLWLLENAFLSPPLANGSGPAALVDRQCLRLWEGCTVSRGANARLRQANSRVNEKGVGSAKPARPKGFRAKPTDRGAMVYPVQCTPPVPWHPHPRTIARRLRLGMAIETGRTPVELHLPRRLAVASWEPHGSDRIQQGPRQQRIQPQNSTSQARSAVQRDAAHGVLPRS